MVSSTRQSTRKRNARAGNMGRARKRAESRHSTPKFPVHLDGYDASAPDAKRPKPVVAQKKSG